MTKPFIAKASELPEPACELGYPQSQLEEIFSEQQLRRLYEWMVGQTMGVCEGRRYDHDKQEYEATGCGPHGGCVYPWDLRGFVEGAPILD